MSIFRKKEVDEAINSEEKNPDYQHIERLAWDVLLILGKAKGEREELSYIPINKYYSGYGLCISYFREKHSDYKLKIDFNGKRVFDDNTFERGAWEKVLEELNDVAYIISNKEAAKRREAEQREASQRRLLSSLNKITIGNSEIDIDPTTKVIVKENTSGEYGEWLNNTNYRIYYNEKVVFDMTMTPYENKYYKYRYNKYEPGLWEEKVDQYIAKIETGQGRAEMDEKLASESIKKLRKIR